MKPILIAMVLVFTGCASLALEGTYDGKGLYSSKSGRIHCKYFRGGEDTVTDASDENGESVAFVGVFGTSRIDLIRSEFVGNRTPEQFIREMYLTAIDSVTLSGSVDIELEGTKGTYFLSTLTKGGETEKRVFLVVEGKADKLFLHYSNSAGMDETSIVKLTKDFYKHCKIKM